MEMGTDGHFMEMMEMVEMGRWKWWVEMGWKWGRTVI